MAGPPDPHKPGLLHPITKYSVPVIVDNQWYSYMLTPQIYVPATMPFLFQIEPFRVGSENITYTFDSEYILMFRFNFSGGEIINIPSISFNCKPESEDSESGLFKLD
ncbi:MAG TPA: hypothetical protein VNY36_03670 [Bacteroidia bacterium]|nr:hypothetical protein [Bacteroidia bacterium]